MAAAIITLVELKTLLVYNPDTGLFEWAIDRRSIKKDNPVGGVSPRGYRHVKIAGKDYLEHRLAWFYFYGSWPSGHIDHRNGIKTDNRITNLRAATRSQNMQNQRLPHGSSDYLGVCFHKQTGKWQARITVDKKTRCLGRFDSQQEAGEAYLLAKRQLHPFCQI